MIMRLLDYIKDQAKAIYQVNLTTGMILAYKKFIELKSSAKYLKGSGFQTNLTYKESGKCKFKAIICIVNDSKDSPSKIHKSRVSMHNLDSVQKKKLMMDNSNEISKEDMNSDFDINGNDFSQMSLDVTDPFSLSMSKQVTSGFVEPIDGKKRQENVRIQDEIILANDLESLGLLNNAKIQEPNTSK